jgi:hypothetical protein
VILFIEISRAAAAADLGMSGDKVIMRAVWASRRDWNRLDRDRRSELAASSTTGLDALPDTRAGAPAPHERFGCYTFFGMCLSHSGAW